MSEPVEQQRLLRRWFLSRVGLGLAAGGTVMGAGAQTARAESAGGRFEPARHPSDDWLDAVPGKHRLVFDTTTPDGFGNALAFAKNYFTANQTGYGLEASDLAVVIVARHQSTMFAYTDAVWSKYGGPIAQRAGAVDPKTKQAPTTNIFFNSTAYGATLSNRGTTIESVLKQGVHLAVCQMATRANAVAIATATGGVEETIYRELVANLVSATNAHPVPAGIVAVNRAQERGYSLVTAG